MQVNPAAERSVTSASRRAQIVAGHDRGHRRGRLPVGVLRGHRRASGLSSTRLISYHFAGKADLIAAVVDDVVAAIGRCVGERVAAEATAAGQLRAYVEGVVSFTATHRAQMRALLQILLSGALPAGSAGTDVAVPSHLEALLRRGQAAGEFRDFDPRVMALAVQRSVESLPFALESDPDLDCAAFARELVTLFELATRRAPA
jgi:AcrR family transcriptional regulator